MIVYIVYAQSDFMTQEVIKIFDLENKAIQFCKEQNDINKPEFDDYGYIPDGGVNHGYYSMELE